jgi:alkanesulfonate monooxygenase SsuD/methylene tetrahydromethanopterin reductase-like flavin-dependent oxidoreductase (luciferase family)
MRYGVVILPEHSWSRTQRLWQLAEELGFEHGWTYDHVVWRWLANRPWYSSITTLTAAALATSRMRLGTLVANPVLRHPVAWAKEVMTIDEISSGRMIFGVGAGGYESDFLCGPGPRSAKRGQRFREFVELTDVLLRQSLVSYQGNHYCCHDVVLHPSCVQMPRVPMAIAAAGPMGMRLAASHGEAWVTSGAPNSFDARRWDETLSLVRGQVDALSDACREYGRDPSTISRVLLTGASIAGVTDSVAAFEDASAAFAEMGITDLVVHWPRADFPFAGCMDTFERIADFIRSPRDDATTHIGGTREAL